MNRGVMVRYRVRPEAAARNAELVRAVYAELATASPDGFAYATYMEPDGVSFVHVATWEDGEFPLSRLPAFRAFRDGLEERCAAPLVRVELTAVGAYRDESAPAQPSQEV